MTSVNAAVETSTTLEQALQALEHLMFQAVDSQVTVLRDASRHILEAGGKRIRPRMLILSYLACGGTQIESVLPIAAAVELVHTASVVHDDINDHGVVRRGRPSINARWGRTFALLTGDFLFTKVYELMAPHKDLNVVLAEATVALVEGETLQAAAVKENTLSRQVYYDIIARKTAALFKSAAQMGALLAGAAAEQVEAMGQYGFNIGLSFQIVDDILDLVGDEAKLGKTAGIDLGQGKGFAAAYASAGGAVALAEAAPAKNPMDIFKQKLMEGDTLQTAREQAQQLMWLATSSLDVLHPSDAREELREMARLVVERDF
ncbi:MAG: polyprenyl synthetase family protein [Chloroflexi bacterium]|nr:polyprenyl synthetase family protein [Chloroflexota bacterium]